MPATYKFIEEFEGIDIYEITYETTYGMETRYSVMEGGVEDVMDMLDKTYSETIQLAKIYGCVTTREYADGNVSSPHMDFETIDKMKNMITVGKSARVMANILGDFTDEEMNDKIERLKSGN